MKMTTGTFISSDGAELFYRRWVQEAPLNGRVLILLHRGHEHSERLENIAANKAFEGYKIFSYDNRGHGHTKADATFEFMNLVRDLDTFVSFVCDKEQIVQESIFVIANSVAGVVASTWVHDYAPKIKGMALIAPAFKIKLYVPFAKEFLKLAIHFRPELNIKSYVKSKFLTHDITEQKRYDRDQYITPNIPARQLTTLLDTAQRVVEDASLITTPTLVLSATKDYVVERGIQGDFYAALSSNVKKFVKLENFYHGVLYETKAQEAIDEIVEFMEECFIADSEEMSDELVKLTQKEYDKIAFGSLPFLSMTNYFIQKMAMRLLGTLSKGMGIGLKYGFDSGVTLDHIYTNKPSGTTWFGRAIDKAYLNSIGWRGIRQRKVNMIAAVEAKIVLLQQKGETVSILDIAGGPARYLIEIASKFPEIEVRVRDYQEQNVNEGRILARDLALDNINYEQCDAFDLVNYDLKIYRPNIVVISGVFELFNDNTLIDKAIKGVTQIISKDGYLLYTGQPWHPQLEQIANVLGNHQQEKWVMRRRSQYELDHLCTRRGFEKEHMMIDDWGIFTVSSAKFNTKI